MRRIVAAGCLAALSVLGCSKDANITGVRIVARFDAAAGLTQLAFAWQVDDEKIAGPVVRPLVPGAPLSSPQDLVVYLDDGLAGHPLACAVQGLALRGGQVVTLRRHEIVLCEVTLGPDDGGIAFPDAAPADVAPTDLRAGDEAALPAAEAGAADLVIGDDVITPPPPPPPPSPDAGLADAVSVDAVAVDASVIAADVGSPTPDAPVDGPPPPADTAAPPIDAPLPVDAPPPPDVMPTSNGCASGARKAFVDTIAFPRIAGCGSAVVSYGTAVTTAASVCAAGWHWCAPAELRAYQADPPPAQVSGTCAWLDSTQATCNVQQSAYNKLDCQGGAAQKASAGAGTSGACTPIDLTCSSPWKYAVQLQTWAASSLSDLGGCINHVGFACGGTALDNASCWIVCCKNP